jgi:hypothetical protein
MSHESDDLAGQENKTAASVEEGGGFEKLGVWNNAPGKNKVWERIGQVVSDERITSASTITFLIALILEMGDEDLASITQSNLAPMARISKRTVDVKTKECQSLGIISVTSRGRHIRSAGVNVYHWTNAKEEDG